MLLKVGFSGLTVKLLDLFLPILPGLCAWRKSRKLDVSHRLLVLDHEAGKYHVDPN